MLLNVSKVEVWTAVLPDRPGAIAAKLESLARAGANLELITAWRSPDKAAEGILAVSPLEGEKVMAAAVAAGFHKSVETAAIRIEAPNEPGMAYRLARALSLEGLNLKGMSSSVIGHEAAVYVVLDSLADAEKAVRGLQREM